MAQPRVRRATQQRRATPLQKCLLTSAACLTAARGLLPQAWSVAGPAKATQPLAATSTAVSARGSLMRRRFFNFGPSEEEIEAERRRKQAAEDAAKQSRRLTLGGQGAAALGALYLLTKPGEPDAKKDTKGKLVKLKGKDADIARAAEAKKKEAEGKKAREERKQQEQKAKKLREAEEAEEKKARDDKKKAREAERKAKEAKVSDLKRKQEEDLKSMDARREAEAKLAKETGQGPPIVQLGVLAAGAYFFLGPKGDKKKSDAPKAAAPKAEAAPAKPAAPAAEAAPAKAAPAEPAAPAPAKGVTTTNAEGLDRFVTPPAKPMGIGEKK